MENSTVSIRVNDHIPQNLYPTGLFHMILDVQVRSNIKRGMVGVGYNIDNGDTLNELCRTKIALKNCMIDSLSVML